MLKQSSHILFMKRYVFRSSVPSHRSSAGDVLSDLIMLLLEHMEEGKMMAKVKHTMRKGWRLDITEEENDNNTPETRVGPDGSDRMMANILFKN